MLTDRLRLPARARDVALAVAILLPSMMLCLDVRAATLLGLVDTGELFASADGGATWSVQSTLPVSDAVAIAAGESSDELFLATESGSVYRSTDAGVNWTGVGAVSASDVIDMAIRSNGDIYLLTKTGSLWQSSDDGATFSAGATLTASNFISLTGAAGTGKMYALTETGEVSRSDDFGMNWATVGVITTPDAVEVRGLGTALYVLTGTGNIAMSGDDGVTWLTIGTISQVHMTSMTTDGTDLVATTKEGLVASSADAMSWSFAGSINQLNVVSLGNDTPSVTGIGDQPPSRPTLRVQSVWPNPMRGLGEPVAVTFNLPAADDVSLEAYDVLGRRVATRPAESFAGVGDFTVSWDIGNLSAGVYFIRVVTASGRRAHAKMAVVR